MPKWWFTAPDDSRLAGRWLLKPRKAKTQRLSAEREQAGESAGVFIGGQDWAEKISYEVARLLGIPAAATELAVVNDPAVATRLSDDPLFVAHIAQAGTLRGSISHDIRPHEWERSPGAQLLAEVDEGFDPDTSAGHTPEAIQAVLAPVTGPHGTPYDQWPAYDVFVGYLLLDALIANTDRHAWNWGVLQAPSGALFLAPSFDHGSALSAGATDSFRAGQLAAALVPQWCAHRFKRKQLRFDLPDRITLLDVALHAFSLATAAGRQHWTDRFGILDLQECSDIVAAVPDLSVPTRTFISEVLATNLNRIRDAF
jgi:hypothetical protein